MTHTDLAGLKRPAINVLRNRTKQGVRVSMLLSSKANSLKTQDLHKLLAPVNRC